MSGGSGKRFWPASSVKRPKQFLPIVGADPLLKMTYKRLEGYFDKDNIYVCSVRDFFEDILDILEIPEDHLILEPVANDTLSAFLYAVIQITRSRGNQKIGIFPCDHFIPEHELFYSDLDRVFENLEANRSSIILMGLTPEYPSTLYGYIETSRTSPEDGFHQVSRFREKPSTDKAEEYIKSSRFFWNSGMLFFDSDCLIDLCDKIDGSWTRNLNSYIATSNLDEYTALPKISFDYAVLEKSDRLKLLKGSYYWNDVGSWEAALEIHQKFGIDILGVTPVKNSSGCWIITDGSVAINTIGIENRLLIVLDSGVLISKFGESHRIKNMI